MNPVIVTRELSRRFGQTVAVDSLSLEVYAGEVFGFLGHNGAGKTTTVRLLNGILDPTGGQATVLDLDPRDSGPELRRRTGVLTEMASLDERLTARDNLRIYAELFGVPYGGVSNRVEFLLATFNLTERATEMVAGFSKGMKQRLAFARALLHEPDILFLDEPTAGLDPVAARHVHELIVRLSRDEKRTVFMCTHNLPEAQALCDRVAVLENGRLLAVGTPGDLANRCGRSGSLRIDVDPHAMERAVGVIGSRADARCTSCGEGTISVSGVVREGIPDLIGGLVSAGIAIYRVTPQEASLEDVYFALLGQDVKVAG